MKRHSLTHRQQTRRFLTGTLFALAVLATGGPAAALDDKTLQGAACQPTSQSQAYATDPFGRILNPSTTQSLVVTCPVVRDISAGRSNGIDVASVGVIDNNGNAGSDVGCTLSSFGVDGLAVEVISRTTTGSSNGQKFLLFTDLASTSGGFYNLLCLIPPRTSSTAPLSGVVMYKIDEQD